MLTRVLLITCFVFALSYYSKASDDSDAQLANIETDSSLVSDFPLDAVDGDLFSDEEVHEREKRSPAPWGGRRRRRWVRVRRVVRLRRVSIRVRRVSLRKTIRKVGRAIRKVPKVIKKAGRQAGRVIRRTVRKAGSVVRKTIKKIKETGRKIVALPRKTGKEIRRIKNKLKEKLAGIIKRKEQEPEPEPEPEPEIVDPEPTNPDGRPNTSPPVKTPKPVKTLTPCDADCKAIKSFRASAEFFKESHCAFYITKRRQRDFFLDRNTNKTLDMWVGDIGREALDLYRSYAEAVKSIQSNFVVETEYQRRQKCMQSGTSECSKKKATEIVQFFNLRCFRPCAGFSGCVAEDKKLKNTIDAAIRAHDKKLNSAELLL